MITAVEPFKEPYVARSVLKQLIRQNIFVTLTPHVTDMSKNFLFTKGVECDYFILILEGGAWYLLMHVKVFNKMFLYIFMCMHYR